MQVHQLLLRSRRRQQLVAAGRHLAQARADRQHQISLGDARGELGIDADADIAGVARMAVVEHVLETEGAAHRQLPALGEALQRFASGRGPAAAAGDDERALGAGEQVAQHGQGLGRRRGERRLDPRQHRRRGHDAQHVLGEREHHRSGPALHRGVEGTGHVLGQPVGIVHLADPLGEAERARAEHLPVVDLLERLAVALLARHLADEDDQRRRVLERGVDADRRVARARSAGDEADPRAAAQLALCSAM
jgi:hypothetical protein